MEKMEMVRDYNVIATEINMIKAQTNKILLNSAIEIGKRLSEAKEIVGHGNWEKWCEEEVSYSKRTASNLIRISKEYGSKTTEELNRKLTTDLGYTQAIAMLQLDSEERENFLEEVDPNQMSVKEFEEAIRDKKALLLEKETLKKQFDALSEKESKMAIDIKEKLEKIEKYETEIKEKNQEAKELKQLIKQKTEKAEKTEADPEAINKIEEEMKLKNKEIKELKEKLKEKPKEVEVEVEVEVVPDGIKEEVAALRLKLEEAGTKLNSKESISRFRSIFSVLVNLFNDLVDALEQIGSESPENYDKYKDAVNKFLEELKIS